MEFPTKFCRNKLIYTSLHSAKDCNFAQWKQKIPHEEGISVTPVGFKPTTFRTGI